MFHTPLAIIVLILGTGWLLWRIARRPPATPGGDRVAAAPGTPAARRRRRAPARAPRDRRRDTRPGTWDVVIVGGGIVGSGALLDAASRGMRAALIEQDDIAAGTSSRSSRLIHGGLRYLEQFRFGARPRGAGRAVAAARRSPRTSSGSSRCCSRSTASRIASKAFYDAGLTLYDILGARHDGGWHRPAVEGGDARAGSDAPARRPARRPALPRRGRGRRPLHAGRGSDRDGGRRRWRSPGSGRRAFASAGLGHHRGPPGRGPRDGQGVRDRDRARWSTRPGSGPPIPATRSAAGRCASCRAVAPTWSFRASGSRTRPG